MSDFMDDLIFSWDDEVEESSFKTIPEGDYKFTITNFERGRYEPKGDSKLPACDQAELEFTIEWTDENGEKVTSKLTYNVKLVKKLGFVVYQLFESVGLIKKGSGKTKFPWKDLIGKSGVCYVEHRKGNNGNTFASVKNCYPAEDAPTVTKNGTPAAKPSDNTSDGDGLNLTL